MARNPSAALPAGKLRLDSGRRCVKVQLAMRLVPLNEDLLGFCRTCFRVRWLREVEAVEAAPDDEPAGQPRTATTPTPHGRCRTCVREIEVPPGRFEAEEVVAEIEGRFACVECGARDARSHLGLLCLDCLAAAGAGNMS